MDFSSYSYNCKSEAQDEDQQTEMLVALLFIDPAVQLLFQWLR